MGGAVEPLQAGDPRQVGAYRLLSKLGAGGMGQVFLGESPGGRKVAVKLLLPQYAADVEFRQRFAREVAAARQVGGFHTAPVVDAGPHDNPPWMVTAYIPGPSLDAAVRENGPLDPGEVRRLGAALAEGLAAVHACGLIHRDLKPSNIILAEDGPRIIDFGIARPANATALTSSGVLIGTFSFMSPEQVRGEQIDSRSDIFALGGVLTYAAAGHGPFDATTIPAIAHRIASQPPDLQGVSAPLREIISACLAKDPADRPSLVDLMTFLSGTAPSGEVAGSAATAWPPTEPAFIPAPVSEPRTATVSRRAMPGEPRVLIQRPSAQRRPPARAQKTRVPPEVHSPPPGGPVKAGGSRRQGPPPFILAVIGLIVITATTIVVIRAVGKRNPPRSLIATISGPSGSAANSVAFSPNGKIIAIGDENGHVYLRRASNHSLIATITPRVRRGALSRDVRSIAFSPDGKILAVGDGSASVYLYGASDHSRIATMTDRSAKAVDSIAFSPDGKMIAAGDYNSRTDLWDLARHSLIASLPGPSGLIGHWVAFSPDSKIVAVGYKGTDLWRATGHSLITTLTDPSAQIAASVAFSPDGRTIAVGDANGSVYLWGASRHSLIATLADQSSGTGILAIAFSPDGHTVAAGYGDGHTDVWNTASHSLIATLRDPSGQGVMSVAFSPDGKTIATSDANGDTYLWRTDGR